jgi:hypothetical protein
MHRWHTFKVDQAYEVHSGGYRGFVDRRMDVLQFKEWFDNQNIITDFSFEQFKVWLDFLEEEQDRVERN